MAVPPRRALLHPRAARLDGKEISIFRLGVPKELERKVCIGSKRCQIEPQIIVFNGLFHFTSVLHCFW